MYSVSMSLVDFIPNILFLLAALNVFKFLNKKKLNASKYIYAFGAFLVFSASTIKALYKLISALGKGEIAWMNNQFFTNQSLGFLICGVGMLTAVISSKKLYSFLPTMALVGIMVAGLATTNISLAILAKREKVKGAGILFIAAILFCLCMGYLSTKDFTQSYMNWAAEGINTVGQLLLFLGSTKLIKSVN